MLEKGYVTLPVDDAMGIEEIIEIADKWGADAIRDSDGTALPSGLLEKGYEVYSTVCLVRADQKWAKEHKDQLLQKYLMTKPVLAVGTTLEIDPMLGYSKEHHMLDTVHDPHEWWQVIDRTNGRVVKTEDWDFMPETQKVIVRNARKWHQYTVNFMTYKIWDDTSMYNHIVNKWTKEHALSVDPIHPETWARLLEYLDQWLATHPHTDVVRLTSLIYHFTIISDADNQQCYVDWSGYVDTFSVKALQEFEKVKGYRLSSEDLVDKGYFNNSNRVPSKKYLDWMDFIQQFVVSFGAECVKRIHNAGKKAMMFYEDHWIGTEPYGKHFGKMNLDALVNPCASASNLRIIADVPGPYVKEIRLFPYFFPDVFKEGGKPVEESLRNWADIRRGLIRKPVDRLSYGGYLHLVKQFPDFIEHIRDLTREFREFKENTAGCQPNKPAFKVAVLNAWGKLRSWQICRNWYELYPDSEYIDVLAGLNADIEFISFDDILENGIDENIKVIINSGEAYSAWSGGEYWKNEAIQEIIREWVYKGNGFIGINEPTAFEFHGKYFQLSDVLGVQKETGFNKSSMAYLNDTVKEHFILQDGDGKINLGNPENRVYACLPGTQVLLRSTEDYIDPKVFYPGLVQQNVHTLLAANTFGEGRAVYISKLPKSFQNGRLMLRAIFWAANEEDTLYDWFCSNINTDCAAFKAKDNLVVVNHTGEAQETKVYRKKDEFVSLKLEPYASKWLRISETFR